jgi:acyl-[acyl-carrier-protein]-phospholipid O-acyltransferase/long-chain-fatty-acid--[acyl-carrier-protein] ligase
MSDADAHPGYRTFRWLNLAQFTGALNDNLFKFFAVFTLIVPALNNETQVNTWAGAVFALPFLLFSEWGGVLADRFSKTTLVRVLKLVEIAVMSLGVVALALGEPVFLYGVLFLMASQSALFGPVKYSLIPELAPVSRLSLANSLIQSMTFIAVIVGMVTAPLLGVWTGGNYALAGTACVVMAAVGYLSSRHIHPTPAVGRRRPMNFGFLASIARTVWRLRTDRLLLLAILGVAYFLFFGAFVQMNVIPFGKEKLGLIQEHSAMLFIPAAFGIGVGSLVAGRLSGRNIEFGLVPIGALGMALSVAGLAGVPAAWDRAAADWLSFTWLGLPFLQAPVSELLLFLLGAAGGFFNVPLTAFVQYRTRREERGEVLAAENFLAWTGAVLAAVLLGLLSGGVGMAPSACYVALGALTLGLSAVAMWILPDFLVRFAGLLLTRLVYRLRLLGREHLPTEGGALLVANHVSWADAFLIAATTQRRVRFIMNRGMYERFRWPRPLFRLMDTILIAEDDPPKRIVTALQQARRELDAGFLVCIFGEGMITRTGLMGEFKKGLERIVKGSTHPIVPVYLHGVWGSIFSYYGGRMFSRPPVAFPYPVTIVFGAPLPAGSSAFAVQQRVAELSVDAWEDDRRNRLSLGERLVRACRREWRRPALADSTGRELSAGRFLVGALALRARLEPVLADGRPAGVWLPPGVGGALVNAALALLRRPVVNLNYTASAAALTAAAGQSGLTTVITSRRFEEKAGACPVGAGKLYLEDILPSLRPREKVCALLAARLLPARWVARSRGFDPDETAAILFSSGSTAVPKGVMLSHHALQCNLDAFGAVHQPTRADNICAALPFFHAFGYTCALWYPLLAGFSAVYHANPLEAATLGELAEKHRSTIMVATPSFLLAYLRKVKPEQFRTLRLLVTGAEKLKPALAEAFRERFSLTPYEGYGATELGPVVSVNLPDRTLDAVTQVGHRPGTVGHPLPGVAVKAVDPNSGAVLGPGESGLLLIRSAARMTGYLNQPEKTAEALREGWYVTGDIGKVDADGFITIQDRLARFSKIAGEMVPHHAVEEALHRLAGVTGSVFVVTSVPDDRRGERLVVLYTPEAGDLAPLLEALRAADLPNLWKPDPRHFHPVPALPLLGSGKLDLQGVKALAGAAEAAGR